MPTQTPGTSTNPRSIITLAERSRHLALLSKMRQGRPLTLSELRELRRYEGQPDLPARSSPAVYDDRQAHAELMRKRRAAARVIEIPEPKNLKRREECLADPERCCRTYWPHIFYNPFARNQKAMIQAIADCLKTGGNMAMSMPRTDGKTSITICVGGVWGAINALVHYLVIINANGEYSEATISDLKKMYETSDEFAADFPEVCYPVRALEGSSQRARTQMARVIGSKYDPELTYLVWATKTIVLPTVRLADGTKTRTSGIVAVAKGADGAIRGLVREGKRPDLVIGDDLETRESAHSAKQVSDRKSLLYQDVMGLSGPNNPMPILILGSIITSGCLMDQLTDRNIDPVWGGVRMKRILTYPKRMDLWEKYIELRKADQRAGDRTSRNAHQFYLDHQAEMDEGAEVSNPYRFKAVKLPDGSLLQSSANESCFSDLCDLGLEAFDAEHQGMPHKDEKEEGSPLDPSQVQRKLNQIPKGFVPPTAEVITIGIDVHKRLLYWVAVAWQRGMIGHIFDYGTETVHSPLTGSKEDDQAEQIKDAIFNALVTFREFEDENGWQVYGSNQIRHANLINIDAGYMESAIFNLIKSGKGRFCNAVMGYGSTMKRAYPSPSKVKQRRIGNQWWANWKPEAGVWIHHVDSDHWKLHIQTGFMLKAETDGSLDLYGDDPVIHKNFARNICAELWIEEFVPGKGIKKYFRAVHKENHYLDALHYATVGADMLRMGEEPRPTHPHQVQVTQADMGSGGIRTSY